MARTSYPRSVRLPNMRCHNREAHQDGNRDCQRCTMKLTHRNLWPSVTPQFDGINSTSREGSSNEKDWCRE
jgi:hypothetical protein